MAAAQYNRTLSQGVLAAPSPSPLEANRAANQASQLSTTGLLQDAPVHPRYSARSPGDQTSSLLTPSSAASTPFERTISSMQHRELLAQRRLSGYPSPDPDDIELVEL
tara:strand:- start:62 stop:385 length:324 start_codon:yes stop_codon:yes gene_type:complete